MQIINKPKRKRRFFCVTFLALSSSESERGVAFIGDLHGFFCVCVILEVNLSNR